MRFIKFMFILLSFIIIYTTIYVKNYFNNISFEQILFTLYNTEGTSINALYDGIFFVFIRTLLSILILIFIFKIVIKAKDRSNDVFKLIGNLYPIFFFLLSIFFSYKYLGIDLYVKNVLRDSKIFDDYYIDSKDVSISDDRNTKNLIYIYLESMEMSGVSKKNGGQKDDSYIPKLEQLALDNLNFSNTSKLGGAYALDGNGWTASALVGQTSGIPVKVPISFDGFSMKFKNVYTLGDILYNNGYDNYFMMGSDASFGRRREYFINHGNYEIMDLIWARNNNLIDDNYYVWWGYEDKKLFEFAKDELLNIASKGKKFNFSMLTADTHFVDGYLDSTCKDNSFDTRYENVFYCSDSMIYEFVSWIKKQDFYKDTVIVIVGDHRTMQAGIYDDSSDRVVYNTIINSDTVVENSDKNRIFTILDMFPTTLASLGFNIEGNRLGFGTNLYSKRLTLSEELGYDYFSNELLKNNEYYNKYIKD